MTTKTTPEEAEKLADKFGTNTTQMAHFYFHRLAALIDAAREQAIAEHIAAQPQQSAPVLPVPAIKVDAFGEVLPTNGRRFVMGDFYSADQMRAAIAAGGAK